MSANDDLIERFGRGDEVLDCFDLDAAGRPNLEARRVAIDLPVWMLKAVDREAARLSVDRCGRS